MRGKPGARAGVPRIEYSELDKLKAVSAMRLIGREHMTSQPALDAARQAINSNPSDATLGRWARLYSPLVDKLQPSTNPALIDRSAVVSSTQEQVISGFIGIRDKSLNILNDEAVLKAAAEKSPQGLAIIMGIAHDKLAALTAIPADAMQASQRLYQLCERTGRDYVALIEDNIAVVESERDNYTVIDSK